MTQSIQCANFQSIWCVDGIVSREIKYVCVVEFYPMPLYIVLNDIFFFHDFANMSLCNGVDTLSIVYSTLVVLMLLLMMPESNCCCHSFIFHSCGVRLLSQNVELRNHFVFMRKINESFSLCGVSHSLFLWLVLFLPFNAFHSLKCSDAWMYYFVFFLQQTSF